MVDLARMMDYLLSMDRQIPIEESMRLFALPPEPRDRNYCEQCGLEKRVGQEDKGLLKCGRCKKTW